MKKIDKMRKKLETAFKIISLKIIDESLKHIKPTGERARPETYFFIDIISEEFKELPYTERRKRVTDELKEFFPGGDYTLEILARDPEE